MNSAISIGIIGDYDGRESHIATEEAITHCALQLGMDCEIKWIPTMELLEGINNTLSCYDGLWCAPGSPYQSMLGAVNAIQFARENDIPFIGTCGGFQHTVIEFALNVLHMEEILEKGFDPYTPNMFLSALSCSLVGLTKQIFISQNSKLFNIYGKEAIEEKYNCNFGLNKEFQNMLEQNGITVIGKDGLGEVRIITLENNRFFVATLFQPQLISTSENPHPLILAYIKSVKDFHHSKLML